MVSGTQPYRRSPICSARLALGLSDVPLMPADFPFYPTQAPHRSKLLHFKFLFENIALNKRSEATMREERLSRVRANVFDAG